MNTNIKSGTRVKIIITTKEEKEAIEAAGGKFHELTYHHRGTVLRVYNKGPKYFAEILPDLNLLDRDTYQIPLEVLEPLSESERQEELSGEYKPDFMGMGLSEASRNLEATFIKEPSEKGDLGYYALWLPMDETQQEVVSKLYVSKIVDDPNGVALTWTDTPKEYQRKGYGRAIVHRAFEDLTKNKGKNVYVFCAFANLMMHEHPITNVYLRRQLKNLMRDFAVGKIHPSVPSKTLEGRTVH